MHAPNRALQKKFSLVPFSRDIKKRNSDYESDENFEPYETSRNFPQAKAVPKSTKNSSPA